MAYLPYEEPSFTIVLSLTSFILLLNGIRYVLDRILYCGIIGEILIGVIWGLPVGGKAWLTVGMQETIQTLGYLGLIGLVFEGGLGTDLTMLRNTAGLSISVATIGLLMPIALSFILLLLPFPNSSETAYPNPLAGFSAGASLCSTSLGTTFAIISSASMQHTRVGVVLIGAAMMDDVVGLVMVNIVTTLGEGGMGGWSIARPIVASFALLAITLVVCYYALKPIWLWVLDFLRRGTQPSPEGGKSRLRRYLRLRVHDATHINFLLSTAVLIVFVTIASFIDASVLFAAFIAGGVVNYLWKLQSIEAELATEQSKVYDEYYKSVMNFLLVPFFFASIGFSIPVKDMFRGSIVWKGLVYSVLMIIGKGFVGLVIYFEHFKQVWKNKLLVIPRRRASIPLHRIVHRTPVIQSSNQPYPAPPHSIAILVGLAMVARGEIGFLIASLSQSSNTLRLQFKDGSAISSGEDVFLVIIWAVVICTIIGPVGVGVTVRHLKASNRQYMNWI